MRFFRQTVRHTVLAFLSVFWLIPIIWLVATSFVADTGPNIRTFFPAQFSLVHYRALLFGMESIIKKPMG